MEWAAREALSWTDNILSGVGGGGEGGYSLKRPYRYVPPQTVWFLRRFPLKTGIDFTHFGLGSDMVFEGTTGVYEGIYRFNSKCIKKKEKYAIKKSFLLLF